MSNIFEGKRILFLLQGNISLVPRAEKAIEALLTQGCKIQLVMVNRHPKWKQLDIPILNKLKVEYTYLSIRREEGLWEWLTTSILHKFSIAASYIFRKNEHIRSFASSKLHVLYWWNKNKISKLFQADVVAGYNAMLYAAWLISSRMTIPFIFDMEDYHPVETIYHSDRQMEIRRRTENCVHLLPKAQFVSFASPMIQMQTVSLLQSRNCSMKSCFTINNTFKASDFNFEPSPERKVQFVWFSQTVSYGRGLELILPFFTQFKDEVELTIIGNMDERFRQDYLSKNLENIHILPAMRQSDLHRQISRYDVGFATEIFSGLEDNKALCLSNKIFTYLLSGLFIFATDTPAQKDFIDSHTAHGIIVTPDAQSLESGFKYIIDNISEIRVEKAKRFSDAKKFSWETEQELYLNKFKAVLS